MREAESVREREMYDLISVKCLGSLWRFVMFDIAVFCRSKVLNTNTSLSWRFIFFTDISLNYKLYYKEESAYATKSEDLDVEGRSQEREREMRTLEFKR